MVDDHPVLRQSLARTLALEEDIEVKGQWSRAEEAFDYIKENEVDVVIMDLKMPYMNGIEASRRIKIIDPKIKIIILSAYSSDEDVIRSVEAGVLGYLPKEVSVEELVNAVRSVYGGYVALDPMVTSKVLSRYSDLKRRLRNGQDLTEIETEVISLAARGYGNKQIADKLDINNGAVKFHFREIYRKLGAKDRAHAVALACKQHLID